MLVYRQPTPAVGLEPGLRQIELAGGASAADRIERLLGGDRLAAVQANPDAPTSLVLDDLNLSTLSLSRRVARLSRRWWQNSSAISSVDERQQPVTLVDQGYPNAERRKDAGVFAADHAGSDNSQRPREPIQIKDVVTREDSVAIEGDMRSAGGLRTGGDDDLPRLDGARAGAVDVVEANGVRRNKRGRCRDELNIVAHQLVAGHVELVLDHPVGTEQQILHRDVLFHGVGSAVEFSRAVPAKIERRLAQRL